MPRGSRSRRWRSPRAAPRRDARLLLPAAAGLCAALAGLCRLEWGLAALAACGARVPGAVGEPARRCARRRHGSSRPAVVVLAAGLGFFVVAAGRDAVVRDGHVLLTGLPPETRHFLVAFSGVRDWPAGSSRRSYSAATWAGLALAAALIASRARPRPPPHPDGARRHARGARGLGSRGRRRQRGRFQRRTARVAGRPRGGARAETGERRRRAGVVRCARTRAVVPAAVPHRGLRVRRAARPLRVRLRGRTAASRRRPLARRRRPPQVEPSRFERSSPRSPSPRFAARVWQYRSIEAVPIAGTDGMLSARPEMAREIEELAAGRAERDARRRRARRVPGGRDPEPALRPPEPDPAQAVPAGLSHRRQRGRRSSPSSRPRAPAAIVIWNRPDVGVRPRRVRRGLRKAIRAWIEKRYRLQPFRPSGTPMRAHPRFVVAWRR